jgi:hypothetical protein
MSEEEPPIPFPLNPIYNPNDWRSSATFDALDIAYLNSNYLKFPLAQAGTETLNSIIVNGTSSLNNNLVMASNDPNQSQITCGYLNLKDLNGNVARTAEIYQDSLNLIITNEATSGKTQFNNDSAGGIPTLIMELDQASGITCQRPLRCNADTFIANGQSLNLGTTTAIRQTGSFGFNSIDKTQFIGEVQLMANNNLTMNSGTGRIAQSTVAGDISTTNNLKKSIISYNNNGNTSAVPALEIFEETGRGAYFVPNTQSGNYGPNVATNDFAIVSRFFSMATTSLCFATGTSLRNHLRLYATTDLSNCSVVLQNGGNLIANASEFRMDYNFNNTPQNTISFNNPINFNPTNNGAISSTRRALNGLGTLSFTDLSANSTSGSITSSIWTDSSLVSSLNGMYYDCGINGGFHQFIARDSGGTASTPIYYGANITSVSNTFIVRNPSITSNRFDIVTDTSQNTNIRARSTTASTDAHIHINCDTVNASSVTTNNAVLNITPTAVIYRRPIQFNYLTSPSASNQLGWFSSVNIIGSAFSSQTGANSMGELIIAPGTWSIEVNFTFEASNNQTYSVFSYALSTSNNTFPTALPYTISYIREPGLNINTTFASRQTNLTLQLATTTSIFILERVTFTGGGTCGISVNYSTTRIG